MIFHIRKEMRPGLTRLVAIATCFLASPEVIAQGEYRLQAGDVMEIVVAGIPELKHRVTVQLDGTITFPLAGTLVAEGAPMAEVRNRLQSAIASKVFRTRFVDGGRELSRTIERDDISAVIVEYKPVFVSGDVAKHGEQVFRPRMQVRQALAAAGGMSPIALTSVDAHILRSEHATACLQLGSGMAREWRIRHELGQKMPARVDLRSIPLQETIINQIATVEQDYLAIRQTEHQQAKEYVAQALKLVADQIAALKSEQEAEERGLLEDKFEHNKARDAFGAGNLPSRRLNDQRRAVLMTSTRLLQTTSQLIAARRSHAELTRELQKIDGQRKIALLAELQEAQIKISTERAKLHGIEDRMKLAGLRPPRPGEQATTKPEISIFRRSLSGPTRIAAELDTELQPGDVVEIVSRSNIEDRSIVQQGNPHEDRLRIDALTSPRG